MPQEDIRGLKDLIHIPYPPLVYVLGAAAVLMILVGIFYGLRKLLRKKSKQAPCAPPIPVPDQILAELTGICANLDEAPESIKRFHFRLSELFRRYLEFRFGFAATDSTTEEVIEYLDGSPQLTVPEKDEIVKILRAADEVKFADQVRSREESRNLGEQTEALVRSSETTRGGLA